MISGPFVELYVSARLEDAERSRHCGQPVRRARPSIWKPRLARTLVRLAAELDREQVRIELPVASA
jgi:hypothetical protein